MTWQVLGEMRRLHIPKEGLFSPLRQLSLPQKERRAAGIPKGAALYAFAYPLKPKARSPALTL
jgi:hypothetical protein